jgi:hypothetical protein
MSNESHKWVLSLGLLGMLVDTLTPHPTLAVEKELLHIASIPPNSYLAGFANERQLLFAHRHFRNRCVLEALAESKRLGENLEPASHESNKGIALADLRLASSN